MSHVAFVKEVYAKFGAGDIPAVLAMFDPSIEWREAEGNPYQPTGEPWNGPQAVLENPFVRLGSEWDRFTVTPQRFHDAGESVVVEGRYTGKELDARVCHVWTLREGKLARFQQYVDTAQLCAVMGA